jgi:hypothetical protein
VEESVGCESLTGAGCRLFSAAATVDSLRWTATASVGKCGQWMVVFGGARLAKRGIDFLNRVRSAVSCTGIGRQGCDSDLQSQLWAGADRRWIWQRLDDLRTPFSSSVPGSHLMQLTGPVWRELGFLYSGSRTVKLRRPFASMFLHTLWATPTVLLPVPGCRGAPCPGPGATAKPSTSNRTAAELVSPV